MSNPSRWFIVSCDNGTTVRVMGKDEIHAKEVSRKYIGDKKILSVKSVFQMSKERRQNDYL